MEVATYIELIHEVNSRGGPAPEEYSYLKKVTNELNCLPTKTIEDDMHLYEALLPSYDINSMVGFSFLKPHGYAGDHELIDKIYTTWKSKDEKHFKWDNLYHEMEATKAVRNRKEYFMGLIKKVETSKSDPLILDLGSGPCSDLHQYFIQAPNTNVTFDCLDMDINAIEYASVICDNYHNKINFIHKNAFRYQTDSRYDLIWSAGLFDYFSDKLFIRLTNRMYELLDNDGELVIGNFSVDNPSRGLMEVILQWYLHHRSEDHLVELALAAGVKRENISINSEETGVNLFLHLNK
ncbi:MAG: extracellular factor (EF) 3-hydroxypalmitic acid methyl ester biosynthesis protein [Cocleimonas sp.]|jgi:extracellular factor (EF) 3-hydroxypalmitic acid methyl ester biosynthesis protein